MRWLDRLQPSTFLACVCCSLGAARCAYEVFFALAFGVWPGTGVLAAFGLCALGLWPPRVRPEARRAGSTAAASLLAVPLASFCVGDLFHDLSIVFPWMEHDRWCAPESGRWVTRATATYFVFVPIGVWASLLGCWHTGLGRTPSGLIRTRPP